MGEAKKDFEVDQDEVNKIVNSMKKKYREEGMQFDEVSSTLKELREIIAEDSYSKVELNTEEDLATFNSGLMRTFGKLYLQFKNFFEPIQKKLKSSPITRELSFYLYSSNMRYSTNQYLAISSAVGVLGTIIGFILAIIISTIILKGNIVLALPIAVVCGFLIGLITLLLVLRIPQIRARSIGNNCSVELPFALRHMSTELKAGMSLYKTMQAIASSDYGDLSEEMARTVNEIEQGTATQVALKHLALRTQSKPLRTTTMHIIRAMKIGGNLSNIMADIAEDVSEDLKLRINAFAQSMNLVAVVFIFMGIVLPVGITILGAIRNSPISSSGQDLFKSIPLSPVVLMFFYVIVMPALFGILTLLVYFTQPKM